MFFAENRKDSDQPSPLGQDRVTSTSVLRFRPTSVDDGVTWACEADHPAVEYSSRNSRYSIILSVLRKYTILIKIIGRSH